MHLFTIENLSLAAEATVILLLLAFAWPQKKSVAEPMLDTEVSLDWEPAKYYFLQNCLHRGLYLQNWHKSQSQNNDDGPFVPLSAEQHESQPTVPLPWKDRLTSLLNRQGMDAVIDAWLSIDTQHRGHSSMSMFALSNYSELVGAKGAMATEQALQRIAAHLGSSLSNEAIVSRYLPDKFMVLHVAATLEASHQSMAKVSEGIAAEDFFTISGESVPLAATISNVDLADAVELGNSLEQLEEGLAQAESQRQSVVTFVGDNWTTSPSVGNPSRSNKSESPSKKAKSTAAVQTESKNNSEPQSSSVAEPTNSEVVVENSNTDESPKNNTEEATASSDISAVANPDDIAALFAQINSNKATKASKSTTPEVPVAANGSSNPAPPVTAPPVPAQGGNTDSADDGAASADDIAALFASMKPSAAATKPAVTAASTAATAQASETPAVAPSTPIELTEAASADDISALFASIKPNQTQPTASEKKVPAQPAKETAASTTRSNSTEVDEADIATADDISALFASMKPPAGKPTTESPKPVELKPATATVPAAVAPKAQVNQPADVDVSEVASADDISALFASIKPNSNAAPTVSADVTPPSVAKPTASKPPVDAAEAQNVAMSTDDISALFASVKPVAKPTATVPQNPSSETKATSEPKTAPKPVITEVEMGEAASPDDISALFASVKPIGNRGNSAVTESVSAKPVQPQPSVKPVDASELSEAATVDDIAELFATVKPAVAPKSAPSNKIETPSSVAATAKADPLAVAVPSAQAQSSKSIPVPPTAEELNDAASADDIAALFATIKPAVGNAPLQPAAAAPKQPEPKLTEEDLNANASSDDISALFAAFKK